MNSDDIAATVLSLVDDWNQDSGTTMLLERAVEIEKERPTRNRPSDTADRDLVRMVWKFEES